MRFLCLHGMGTNNKVFETQTAALRYALADSHTYEFAEGVISTEMHPDIGGIFPATDSYYHYFDANSVQSCKKAMENLEGFIAIEGPFDGVIGFSQGAALAAAVMARRWQKDPVAEATNPIFKCAVFFGAGLPCDPAALEAGQVRGLSPDTDWGLIRVPTTHVWGREDSSSHPPILAELCDPNLRQVYVHEGGHGIPGSQMSMELTNCVLVIKRSIFLSQRGN
ncbi:serine hydrolase FSH [Xylariaceae sp. FL1272]|nr:serine hydrolase FSH [Xylariaceae sp. FL1272]